MKSVRHRRTRLVVVLLVLVVGTPLTAASGEAETVTLAPTPAPIASIDPPTMDGSEAHPYVVPPGGLDVHPAYHKEQAESMTVVGAAPPPLMLCTNWLRFTVVAKTLLRTTAYHWHLNLKWCIATAYGRNYTTRYQQYHSVTNKDSFNSDEGIVRDEKWYWNWKGVFHAAHYSHVIGKMMNHIGPYGDLEHNPWIKAWVYADGGAHATGDADD